jgi:hypothetical protein
MSNALLEAWLSPTGIAVTAAVVGSVMVYMAFSNTSVSNVAKEVVDGAVDVVTDLAKNTGKVVGEVTQGVLEGVGNTVITAFGGDVDKVNCAGTGSLPLLSSCREGWHDDGLTCREPFYTKKNGGLGGGRVVGKLDRHKCPPGKYYSAGLCYYECHYDASTNTWRQDINNPKYQDNIINQSGPVYRMKQEIKRLENDVKYFSKKSNKN